MTFSYQADLKLFMKTKCKATSQSNRTHISGFKILNFKFVDFKKKYSVLIFKFSPFNMKSSRTSTLCIRIYTQKLPNCPLTLLTKPWERKKKEMSKSKEIGMTGKQPKWQWGLVKGVTKEISAKEFQKALQVNPAFTIFCLCIVFSWAHISW